MRLWPNLSNVNRFICNVSFYLQCVIPNCASLFVTLEHVTLTRFLPALFGCEVSPLEQHLFSLPVHWGGLGLVMPSVSALFNFSASQRATQVIVNAIIGVNTFELDSHFDAV